MRRNQHLSRPETRLNLVAKDLRLPFVGQHERDDVAFGGRTGGGNRPEAVAHGALMTGHARQLGDDHAAPAIAQVLGLCAAL